MNQQDSEMTVNFWVASCIAKDIFVQKLCHLRATFPHHVIATRYYTSRPAEELGTLQGKSLSSLPCPQTMEKHKNSSDAGAQEDSGSMGSFQGLPASPGWHYSLTAPEWDLPTALARWALAQPAAFSPLPGPVSRAGIYIFLPPWHPYISFFIQISRKKQKVHCMNKPRDATAFLKESHTYLLQAIE